MLEIKHKSQQRTKYEKEPNGNFRTEKYSKISNKLTRLTQQQSGDDKKINEIINEKINKNRN